jgi:predicted nucleic acid-binding protein
MSTALVDTSVLLDVLTDDPQWGARSSDALAKVSQAARLIINPIIYAEVSVRFPRIEDVDEALPRDKFVREPIPYEGAFLAGKAYLLYRRRGGPRPSLLPDFLIGGHAAIAGYRLLTRDPDRFRSYFPKLDLIAP